MFLLGKVPFLGRSSEFQSGKKTFIDSTGEEQIAPDPQAIDPKLIEIPTIWALSQIAPDLVPHV